MKVSSKLSTLCVVSSLVLGLNLSFATRKDSDWTAAASNNRAALVVLDKYTESHTSDALEEIKTSLDNGAPVVLNVEVLEKAGLDKSSAAAAMSEILAIDDQN